MFSTNLFQSSNRTLSGDASMRETSRDSAGVGVVLRRGCSPSNNGRAEASSRYQRLRGIRPRSFSRDEREVWRHRLQQRPHSPPMQKTTHTPNQETEIKNLDLPERNAFLQASREHNAIPSSGRGVGGTGSFRLFISTSKGGEIE